MSILLGVPQGSVLGPLFFLLMINDLAYMIELMCKLFADDTTLGDCDKDLNSLITRFVKKLRFFLEWCEFNTLDVNWDKTFFMFVTNKRVKLPNEILVNTKIVENKIVETKVSVVSSFKLLGVTLDNKLTFSEHCSNIKRIINRKLYSIKRLFFLCTSVKIHFFKTFILPYFDYCLSLIIYFPTSAYQSLCNCFNLCLYKLFKFQPVLSSDDEDEEKIMNDFTEKLQSYDLFTFQSRIYNKLLVFAHGIKTNGRAPIELKSYLYSVVPAEDQDFITTETSQVDPTTLLETVSHIDPALNIITQAVPPQDFYSLRKGRTILKNKIPDSKYERLSFKYFFPRLLNTFKNFDFNLRSDSFRIQVNLNLKQGLKLFLEKFPKFNIKYSAFFRKKKKLFKSKRNKII
jgi:hypothetical protein